MDSVKRLRAVAVKDTKGRDLAQVLLFIAIAYTIMFTAGFAMNAGAEQVNMRKLLWGMIAAFSPATACVLVRYLFGEGFRDDILFPKFAGHKKAYILSLALPLLFGIIVCVSGTFALGAGFQFKGEDGAFGVVLSHVMMSAQLYYYMILLLGEELGWRAFLYDKLEKLSGIHGSIVIGGVLWGVWHLPPLMEGLNFGKEAPGFPLTNVVLMCVFCIFLGAVMQLLRKMSDSVIAPLIAHALIDSVCNAQILTFLSPEMVEEKRFLLGLCMIGAAVAVGLPCWVVLAKRSGEGKKQ